MSAAFAPEIPDTLRAVLTKGLSASADARYPTMVALLDGLRTATLDSAKTDRVRPTLRASRRWWVVAAVALPGGTQAANVAYFFHSAADVPEPMTLALFGAGLAGLGAMRRRKVRRSA